MWKLQPTTQWEKDRTWYEKKRPNELAAILRNLERYIGLLNVAKNVRAQFPGYVHPEPLGVVAIDQKGGGSNLQETRLYTFPDEDTKTIYLLRIGDKQEQPKDIQFCKEFVEWLRKQKETP